MATADRLRRLLPALPIACVMALAAGAGAIRWTGTGEEATPRPLAVSASSIHHFHDLAGLVSSSDLVVRGRVVATSRGRAVGDGDGAVLSRVVTVRVDEVLAGPARPSTVLVEEEGWLVDGTPIEVNGLAPSEEGMDAIWFLDQLPAGELPAYLVINEQGRYAIDAGGLRGADMIDPLVARLEALGPDALASDVRALSPKS